LIVAVDLPCGEITFITLTATPPSPPIMSTPVAAQRMLRSERAVHSALKNVAVWFSSPSRRDTNFTAIADCKHRPISAPIHQQTQDSATATPRAMRDITNAHSENAGAEHKTPTQSSAIKRGGAASTATKKAQTPSAASKAVAADVSASGKKPAASAHVAAAAPKTVAMDDAASDDDENENENGKENAGANGGGFTMGAGGKKKRKRNAHAYKKKRSSSMAAPEAAEQEEQQTAAVAAAEVATAPAAQQEQGRQQQPEAPQVVAETEAMPVAVEAAVAAPVSASTPRASAMKKRAAEVPRTHFVSRLFFANSEEPYSGNHHVRCINFIVCLMFRFGIQHVFRLTRTLIVVA
jgi:hypothetical protein